MPASAAARRRSLAIAVTLLIAAGFVAASYLLPFREAVLAFGEGVQSLGWLGACLFAVLFAAGAMMLLPTSPFAFVAGLLYGPAGLALVWLAMTAVAAVSLPLARWVLADRVRRAVRDRRFLRTVVEVIDEDGWRMVLLVRVSGIVPFGLQNYIFGATGVPFRPYLAATAVGVLPSILVYGGAGAFANAATSSGYQGVRLGLLAAAVLAGITLVVATARKVKRRLALAS